MKVENQMIRDEAEADLSEFYKFHYEYYNHHKVLTFQISLEIV